MCVCVFQSEGRKCRWNTVCVCVCLRVKEGSVGGTLCVFQSEGRKCRWNTVCVCVCVSE